MRFGIGAEIDPPDGPPGPPDDPDGVGVTTTGGVTTVPAGVPTAKSEK